MNPLQRQHYNMLMSAPSPRQPHRMHFQRECVKESGKSAQDIQAMSRQDRVTFSRDIHLCTDVKTKVHEIKNPDQHKHSQALADKVRKLIMQ